MPLRTDVKKILVIGSGPIQIGQGCEFDYSGTQACLALRGEGFEVVLINSNPATIMTDIDTAHAVYIEPLTLESVRKVIAREAPDAILPTMGGQVALNLFMELHAQGDLERAGLKALGVTPRTVTLAEDRRAFRDLMEEMGLGVVKGGLVRKREDAYALAATLAYPLIVRASFTLGGTGGGIARTEDELEALVERGFQAMPPHGELSIEESIVGWKEYELEVMRDALGNFVVVCGIENVNPMGVHTGDSVTVAPTMTLTDREYQSLREMAKRIFAAVGMETGGANIQFAVHPESGRCVVIEMNPRVSRSSALVSKATGYPIAFISAKLSVGRTLTELSNEITGHTPAAFEPAIDYVAVKIPRWDFEKFPQAGRDLGIQMKSVGEVLAFGRSFKDAFQKAWRSLESGLQGWTAGRPLDDDALRDALSTPTPELFFDIKTALLRGWSVEDVHALTGVGPWFLRALEDLVGTERQLARGFRSAEPSADLPADLLRKAKRDGFSNAQIAAASGLDAASVRARLGDARIRPTFKMVDTCAAEFEARTPYYFKTYEEQDDNRVSNRRKIVILGSGPNRIGQGVEFDYSCVHAVKAVQDAGYEAILINSNPETVSTDFHTSDKLYVEPLHEEDVLDVLDAERPDGVLVQFGGQSPLKLAKAIEDQGHVILGSPYATIERAENREAFGRVVAASGLSAPAWGTCLTVAEAVQVAARVGYPALVRPSYVLGGRGMQVVRSEAELRGYVDRATRLSPGHPVLIDCYLEGATEFDVDVLSDGEEVHVPAIMEHIEEAGIHSGDSACVIPPHTAGAGTCAEILDASAKLARALNVVGLLNIQFAHHDGRLHVLEVNARSSRSVPFVAKSTGVPLARLGAQVCLGAKIRDLALPPHPRATHGATDARRSRDAHGLALKVPVFPFHKFPTVTPVLGPEMRSIGEVMSFGATLGIALRKGLESAGLALVPGKAVVLLAEARLADALAPALRTFTDSLGCTVLCTAAMCAALAELGVKAAIGFSDMETLLKESERALVHDGASCVFALEALGATNYAPLVRVLGPLAVRRRVPFVNAVRAVQPLADAFLSSTREDAPRPLSAFPFSTSLEAQ